VCVRVSTRVLKAGWKSLLSADMQLEAHYPRTYTSVCKTEVTWRSVSAPIFGSSTVSQSQDPGYLRAGQDGSELAWLYRRRWDWRPKHERVRLRATPTDPWAVNGDHVFTKPVIKHQPCSLEDMPSHCPSGRTVWRKRPLVVTPRGKDHGSHSSQ
jgi:hypothetical protein